MAIYIGGDNKVDLEPSKLTVAFSIKVGLTQIPHSGVMMDVVTPDQALVSEGAGACAVMALERVPADIRAQGGVALMSDPGLIHDIKRAVTIPVMAKAHISHFVEAQILEPIGVDYAALMMQLGCDNVFVSSGIFRSDDPAHRARAIV